MPYDQVMSKFKSGNLTSGGSGKPVTDRRQAIAIMLSEKKKSKTNPEYASKRDGLTRAISKVGG